MKKILLSPFTFTLLFIVGLEVAAGLTIRSKGNSLDKTRHIVVPDAALGWRHGENLQETFLDRSFHTDGRGFRRTLSSSGPKVLFLGPSSTVGWGVHDEESYPSIVGTKFAVTNAAQIGHSTFQGLRLFRNELTKEEFAVTVISYGVNDVDLNRFYFQSELQDSAEFAEKKSAFKTSVQRWMFGSSLMSVLQKLIFSALSRLTPQKGSHERMEKLIRVTEEEFRRNLRSLATEVRQAGSQPVFMATVTFFERKNDPEIDFRQDLIQKRLKRFNEIMREVSAELNVPLVDPGPWLKGERSRFFVDPVHFSVEGNRLIGAALRDKIEELTRAENL